MQDGSGKSYWTSSGQERSRTACTTRLPLLLTNRLDLDLDGQDHYDPKQEPTMVSRRFLLTKTASRTTLGAVAVLAQV
jgi:hypothetical protein